VLVVTKQERLKEIIRRLSTAAPFADGVVARRALEETMKAVEDEFSGIPANPDAAAGLRTDGRMYPPDDKFAFDCGCTRVKAFRMFRHQTLIGDNGALLIKRSDGAVEIDLAGSDGQRVSDLLIKGNYAVN
jgi:hypothetical protein